MMELFAMKGDNIPQDSIYSIQYQPLTPDQNETAKAEVHKIIGRRHGFDPNLTDAFEEWDTIKSQRTVGVIFTAMDVFLGGVGVVTLALGAIGIINIMLVAVTERTREIGLRKALGATRRSILFQFFLEGSFLTLLSGSLGVVGAVTAVQLLSKIHLPLGFDTPKIVPASALGAVLALAIAGTIAGLYPARKAAMMEPIEALRQE